METIPQHPHHDSVLAQAFKIIDPSGYLEPGAMEYNTIRDMILSWIDECGPDHALKMAEAGAEHLERWRKFL
jgi:hypothetical protein